MTDSPEETGAVAVAEEPKPPAEAEKKYLDRAGVLNADDAVTEDVYVPEWGGWIIIKGMSGQERDDYEAEIVTMTGKGKMQYTPENARAKLVVDTAINPDGSMMFSDKDVFDLGKKSAAALQRAFKVAQKLAGLSDEDMEELLGNSKAAQSGSSSTD